MGVICGIVFIVCALIFAELFSVFIAILVCRFSERKERKGKDEC